MELVCFCQERFETVDELFHHAIENSHRIKCSCGDTFATDTQLKKHMREIKHFPPLAANRLPALKGMPGRPHESAIPEKTPEETQAHGKQYKCRSCPEKVFKTLEALEAHRSAKEARCSTCGVRFHDHYNKRRLYTAGEQLVTHQEALGHWMEEKEEVNEGHDDQGEDAESDLMWFPEEEEDVNATSLL